MEALLRITDMYDGQVFFKTTIDMIEDKYIIVFQNSEKNIDVSLVLTMDKSSDFFNKLKTKLLLRKDEIFKISLDNFTKLLPKREIVIGKMENQPVK